jgi:hypothetical protein
MTTRWDRVLAVTEGHSIDNISVHFDSASGQSWTYVYCTCGNEPGREAFTEPWEYTDHVRRLVFNALTEDEPAERP